MRSTPRRAGPRHSRLPDRLAVLSDIHGNIWALMAVMADIIWLEIETIVQLGDALYGPLDPAATARYLMGIEMTSVRGNQDRVLLDPHADPTPTWHFSRQSLSQAALAWLEAQPARAALPGGILLCHGTPATDEHCLLETLSPQGSTVRDEAAIAADLATVSQDLILCGHSHIPRCVRLSDGRLIVNPGSVGLPAYRDAAPLPHKMETGSPHARYAVLTRSGGWQVEHRVIPYPWEKAARQARANGREDWAVWLSSGRG